MAGLHDYRVLQEGRGPHEPAVSMATFLSLMLFCNFCTSCTTWQLLITSSAIRWNPGLQTRRCSSFVWGNRSNAYLLNKRTRKTAGQCISIAVVMPTCNQEQTPLKPAGIDKFVTCNINTSGKSIYLWDYVGCGGGVLSKCDFVTNEKAASGEKLIDFLLIQQRWCGSEQSFAY